MHGMRVRYDEHRRFVCLHSFCLHHRCTDQRRRNNCYVDIMRYDTRIWIIVFTIMCERICVNRCSRHMRRCQCAVVRAADVSTDIVYADCAYSWCDDIE